MFPNRESDGKTTAMHLEFIKTPAAEAHGFMVEDRRSS
jgi:hypothetical protein